MALASAFAVLAQNHDLQPVTDEGLDLLTPNQRIQKIRRSGVSVWVRPATATARVSDEDDPEVDQKAKERKKWAGIFRRAEEEEARQQSFGRYSAGSLYFFGPEPDKDEQRFPKTLRQRFIRLAHQQWFDRLVLAVTIVYCLLQATLENKICENQLLGHGGENWDGENGVMKRFYPFMACNAEETRLRYLFLGIVNYLITLLFTAEMAVKVTAFGFVLHKHAYLRDGWTFFEFVMVVVSWAQFLPGAPNLAMIRLVRVMRPLQLVSRLPGMRPVATTLLKGARPVGSVVLFCFFLTFLVGLVSIEIFAGGMRGRCFHDDGSPAHYGEPFDATVASGLQRLNSKPILCNPGIEGFGKLFALSQPCPPSQTCSIYTDPMCMALVKEAATGIKSTREEMDKVPPVCNLNENPDPTFSMDNLGRAMMTITRTLMLDNWAQTMRFLQAGFSTEAPVVVFVVIVVLGSWFVPHLAIAVVQDTYHWELKVDTIASKGQSLVQETRMGLVQMVEIWIALRLFRLQAFGHSRFVKYRVYRRLIAIVGKGDAMRRRVKIVRRILRAVTSHSIFDSFIMAVILMNTLTMCINFFDQSLYEDNICGVLSQAVYGSRNCTGPLVPFSRRSVISLPFKGYFNGTSGTSGLVNTKGFCAFKSNSTIPCFESWSAIKTKNVTLDGVCASGGCGGMPQGLSDFVEILNTAFTIVFVAEMVLKLLGHGLAEYTMSWSNIFDAFIAITSLVEMTAASDKSGVGALRSFRVLRVTRLFRKFPALKNLLAVVVRALPRSVPLIFIILLFLFISSEVGTQLMGGYLHTAVCEGAEGAYGAAGCFARVPRTNFDSVLPTTQGYGGMVTVLAMITGQRWSEILRVADAAGRGPEVVIYSVVVMIVGVYLILSLSLTILTRTYIEVQSEISGAAGAVANNKGALAKLRQGARRVGMVHTIHSSAAKSGMSFDAPKDAPHDQPPPVDSFDAVAPGDCEYGDRPATERERGIALLLSILARYGQALMFSAAAFWERFSTWPGQIRGYGTSIWKQLVDLLQWTRSINRVRALLLPRQQKVNDFVNSTFFVTFITMCIIISTIVLLSDDPLGPMSECCPTTYGMVTNSSVYFGSRFCVRGDDVAKTCEGHGICSPKGTCQCDSKPEQFTGDKCQCKWFGSEVCGVGWTYIRHSNTFYVIEFLNYLFLAIFTLEMALKWFAAGIIYPTGVFESKGAPQTPYMRDPWNVIDGFVVLVSLASAFAGNSNLTGLKGLRAVRCLRPLRMLRRFSGLRAVVNCLLQCIPHVARVFGVLMVVVGIFAILGLQLFCGKFHSCMDPSAYPLSPIASQIFYPVNEVIVPDLFSCMDYGGVWDTPRGHFDNFFEAFVSMFTLATRDGWVTVMDQAVDSTSTGHSPLVMNQPAVAVFFLVYILVVYCFLMHSLVAAVLQNYVKLKETTGGGFLSPAQLAWLQTVRESWNPKQEDEKPSSPFTPRAKPSSPAHKMMSTMFVGHIQASFKSSLAKMISYPVRNAKQNRSESLKLKNIEEPPAKTDGAGRVEVIEDRNAVAAPPPGAPPSWARSAGKSQVDRSVKLNQSKFQDMSLTNFEEDEKEGKLAIAINPGSLAVENVKQHGSQKPGRGEEEEDAIDRMRSSASDFGGLVSSYGISFWSKFKTACAPREGSRAAIVIRKAQPYFDVAKRLEAKLSSRALLLWKIATVWSVILVDLRLFKIGINFCIAANVFLMSLRSFPSDKTVDSTVSAFDSLFTVIFFFEMILKMLAFGQRKYWSSSWDVFDGIVSSVCMLGVLIQGITGVSLPAMTVLRGFRVLRVLRLVRSAQVLRTILFTLMISFPALFNVLFLMLLFFLIYASLGVPLFYNVRWAEEFTGGINSFTNFQGVNNALATLFTVSTGDGWVGLMHSTFFDDPDFSCELDVNLDGIYYDETGCGSKAAGLVFFISFFILHNYIVLNLIVVIVVDSFSVAQESGARSSSSNRSIEAFADAWRGLDPDLTGYIHMGQLRDLIIDWNPTSASMRSCVRLLRKASPYFEWKWVKTTSGDWTRLVSFESSFYAISRTVSPQAILPPAPMLSSCLQRAFRSSKNKNLHRGKVLEDSLEQHKDHAARVIQYAVTAWSEHFRMMCIVKEEHELEQIEIQRNSWIKSAQEGGLDSLMRALKHWYRMKTKSVLQVGPSEFWGSVVVRVLQGKNLPETERAGKCDAFITISCGSSKRDRSNVALDTYDPVWNEEFAYNIKGTDDSVRLDVWDDDVVANRYIGSCSVPVSRICLEDHLRAFQWYELSEPSGMTKGNVQLDIAVETFKWSIEIGIIECIALPCSFIRESPSEEMNPYCCVVLGHNALTTTPRLATFAPVFREKLHFDLADMDEEIRIVVLNNRPEHEAGDDFVAQVKVNAAQLLHPDNLSVNFWTGKRSPGSWDVSVWLPLEPEDGMRPWGQLRITCVEARGLPKMDAFGKVDPFCVVRAIRPDGPDDLRGLKTSVKIATFEPKWQEDFAFVIMHADSLAVVEIYDHDWSGDRELIGVVKLPLAPMAGLVEPLDAWHEIQRAGEGGASAIDGSLGQIRLITSLFMEEDYCGSFGYVHVRVNAHLLAGVPTLRDMGEASALASGAMPDEPADLVDGHLHIAVMEAKNLPNMGGIEGVHAFCEVCVVGAHVRFQDKTRVEHSRNEIQWCDEFTVRRLERDADLSVVVRDPGDSAAGSEIGRVDMRIRDILGMLELETLRSVSSAGDGLPGEDAGLLDKWFDLEGGLGSVRLVLSLGPRVGGNEYADVDQFVTRGILRNILEKDVERIRQEQRNKAVEMAKSSHIPNLGTMLPLPLTAPPKIPEGGGLRVMGRSKVSLQNPTAGLLQAGVGRTSRQTPLRSYGGMRRPGGKAPQTDIGAPKPAETP